MEGMATAAWPAPGQGRLTGLDARSTVRCSTAVTLGAGSARAEADRGEEAGGRDDQHQHEQGDEPASAASAAVGGARRPPGVPAAMAGMVTAGAVRPELPASAWRNDSRVNGATMRGVGALGPSSLTSR